MNLAYLIPRVIRHFLPDSVTRFLLRHGRIIRPGLETSDPRAAVERYCQVLSARGETLSGKRVLVFGYGGYFAVGCALLEAGAGHVVLCDRYAPPDNRRNAALLPRYAAYLSQQGRRVRPRPERLSLVHADVRAVAASGSLSPFEIVLSSSVYEHLDDVDGITQSLAALTLPQGQHIHFIDLRDHFFKYPFEMLSYSERAWRNWLNPRSNHNRFRLGDYRRSFERAFERVEITVLAREPAAYERARARIRPEFSTGDPEVDAVTLIQVVASAPRGTQKPAQTTRSVRA